MGRKLQLLPTCGSPSKTLSFRATAADFDDMVAAAGEAESSMESVIQGLSTDRFFFKPGKTNSILEEAKEKQQEEEEEGVLALKESVSMMEMESTDPFLDFKKSMQEMVEADEGLKEWENLQELLSLYLAVNDKINHSYIIGAFVDLLLLLNHGSPSSSCSSSPSLNGQGQSLSTTGGSNKDNQSNKKKMILNSNEIESPDSAVSFTSSSLSASCSGNCSSTSSHCLSSCSLEEDEDDNDGGRDKDDHNSPQKDVVSDNLSSLKI